MAKKDVMANLEDTIADALEDEQVESTEDATVELKGGESEEVVADTDTDEGEAVEEADSEDKGETPSEEVYKIGEDEYSADELVALLEKGALAKRVEDEQKLDIGQLLPEFTRRSQLLKDKEALRNYYRDSFKEELGKQADVSEEQKRIDADIEAARKLGFITKADLEEFRTAVKQETKEEVEEARLSKEIDRAASAYGVDRRELIEFMYGLRLEDPDYAAEKLGGYKKIISTKPRSVAPEKPEVLSTEKKGGGLKVPKKEKPIPHPDKDPQAYEARILELLEHKEPEEV